MATGTFRAGGGRVSITPPLTAPHASWGAQVHVLPDGVDADLWATALVVDDGVTTAAWIDLDLVIVSTATDLHAFWQALFAGAIVPPETVEQMVAPRSDVPSESKRYGLGFWLHESRDEVVMLEGYDAGVSAHTMHDRSGGVTFTVLSNTSGGAWPVVRHLSEALSPG